MPPSPEERNLARVPAQLCLGDPEKVNDDTKSMPMGHESQHHSDMRTGLNCLVKLRSQLVAACVFQHLRHVTTHDELSTPTSTTRMTRTRTRRPLRDNQETGRRPASERHDTRRQRRDHQESPRRPPRDQQETSRITSGERQETTRTLQKPRPNPSTGEIQQHS